MTKWRTLGLRRRRERRQMSRRRRRRQEEQSGLYRRTARTEGRALRAGGERDGKCGMRREVEREKRRKELEVQRDDEREKGKEEYLE